MKNLKRIGSLILALAIVLSLTIPAFAADTGYTDVSPDAWYAGAVEYVTEHELMNGTGNGRFSPDDTLTRAMVATVLYRAEGEPAVSTDPRFTDADAGVWYSDAVVWADAGAIMQGYGNGRFGTGDPVTREDLATILWRYVGEKDAGAVSLPDASSVSEYARTAVNWAVGNSVLTLRDDGRAAPREAAVRAEVAVALMACLKDADLPKPTEPDEGGKVLVVYYSATGSTERVAGYIADTLNADTFELVPAEPYSSADLNWTTPGSRVNREHDDESLRDVKLVNNTVANWADYDTILIG